MQWEFPYLFKRSKLNNSQKIKLRLKTVNQKRRKILVFSNKHSPPTANHHSISNNHTTTTHCRYRIKVHIQEVFNIFQTVFGSYQSQEDKCPFVNRFPIRIVYFVYITPLFSLLQIVCCWNTTITFNSWNLHKMLV